MRLKRLCKRLEITVRPPPGGPMAAIKNMSWGGERDVLLDQNQGRKKGPPNHPPTFPTTRPLAAKGLVASVPKPADAEAGSIQRGEHNRWHDACHPAPPSGTCAVLAPSSSPALTEIQRHDGLLKTIIPGTNVFHCQLPSFQTTRGSKETTPSSVCDRI